MISTTAFMATPRLLSAAFVLLLGATVFLALRRFQEKKGEQAFSTLVFGLAALPLPLYPFVLMANLMSLAGYWEPPLTLGELLSTALFFFFLAATTLYPLLFVLCLYLTRVRRRQGKSTLLVSLLPLAILLLFLLLIYVFI